MLSTLIPPAPAQGPSSGWTVYLRTDPPQQPYDDLTDWTGLQLSSTEKQISSLLPFFFNGTLYGGVSNFRVISL